MNRRSPYLPVGLIFGTMAICACGTLGSDHGGGANLPNRGIAPYENIVFGEADFLIENTPERTVSAPSAHVRNGRLNLFYVSELASGELCVAHQHAAEALTFADPQCVLELSGAPEWVGNTFASPSLAHDGAEWWMALAVDDGAAIALIPGGEGDSFDWSRAVRAWEAPVGTTLRAPSLVWEESRFTLYAGSLGRIERATGLPPEPFGESTVVLEPGMDCEEDACWDESWVGEPDVRLAVGGDGAPVYRMFYVGERAGKRNLGFAASYDGIQWVRYARNPVIGGGPEQGEPSQVRLGGKYYLFFMEYRSAGDSGCVAALNDAGSATDYWSDD